MADDRSFPEARLNRTKKFIKIDLLKKNRILGEQDGYCLPGLWLEMGYKQSLKTTEMFIFQKAVRELIRSGIVEPHEGVFDGICLVDKEAGLLFSCSRWPFTIGVERTTVPAGGRIAAPRMRLSVSHDLRVR